MTIPDGPFHDDRLKGSSSGEYFQFTCGKCGAIVNHVKFRRTPSGPFMDYQCNACPNKGTLKLEGIVVSG